MLGKVQYDLHKLVDRHAHYFVLLRLDVLIDPIRLSRGLYQYNNHVSLNLYTRCINDIIVFQY